ncbi:hypothetical protein BH10CHL1_BH10CHL1_16010 [soil metagenome]
MFKQKNLAAAENFAKKNRVILQTVGVVTLAASTGGVTAILVSKSILMAKGIGTAKAVLAAIGTAAAKTGIVVAAPVATSKVAALLGALVPLTAGAVGGGAVGWTLTQKQVSQVEERLNEQVAQTAAYQAETERLQTTLAAGAEKTNPAPDAPAV